MPEAGASSEKAFTTNAFAGLGALREIRKSDAQDREEAHQARRAQLPSEKPAHKPAQAVPAGRTERLTMADLLDTSNLSDAEIFAESMGALDGVDLYQEKFNKGDVAKEKMPEDGGVLTMSEEEREFALFTQEMALSKVRRIGSPQPTARRQRARHQREGADPSSLETLEAAQVHAAPSVHLSHMHTQYVDEQVTVTQVSKGDDVLVGGEGGMVLSASQSRLMRDINRYQERYGAVMTLKLRGLAHDAAMVRLDDFLTAAFHAKCAYGLIICGKGLGSPGQPVVKHGVMAQLHGDDRVLEYVPVLDDDGDFGAVYVALKKK